MSYQTTGRHAPETNHIQEETLLPLFRLSALLRYLYL
jgi:hypothetical protein